MKIQHILKTVTSTARFWIVTGLVLAGVVTAFAQVQHPRAARRVRAHRVHTRRENVVDVRQNRVDNVRDRRVAARSVLPSYAPARVATSGTIVVPPAPVPVKIPVAKNPPAQDNAIEGLPSDKLADPFEGSPSYPVTRLEDGGVTVVLKTEQGETKVRMVGVAAINLGDRVKLPERFAAARLPSTERFVGHLLKGESVYVVYDTQVAAEDADGKIVAYLFRAPDGLLVNLEVIRAGFAVTDTNYDFDQKATFIEYQNRARGADKGIYGLVKRLRARSANR